MSTAEDTKPASDQTVDEVKPGNLWKREKVLDLPDGRRGLIRLPNQFQHADIRQAALAAKARRIRQFRDTESDAYVVLEDDMQSLLRDGDQEALVQELVDREWWRDHLAAADLVKDQEEYEHIERDQERWAELEQMTTEQRSEFVDEHASLGRHVAAFSAAVDAEFEKRVKPRRDALEALGMEKLVDMTREERIRQEGSLAFNAHFSLAQVYSGSYELAEVRAAHVFGKDVDMPIPGPRLFASMKDAREADPNMLDALTNGFGELEETYSKALQGNS